MEGKDGFHEAYKKYYPVLLKWVEQKLRGCDELYNNAEDYVHEAFLRLYLRCQDPEVRENTERWLKTTLHNHLVDEWRRISARNHALGVPVGLEKIDYVPIRIKGVSSDFEIREMFELRDMMKRVLNEEEYLLFSLRYLFGYRYVEVARKMGCSVAMTGKRLWELKKKMAVIMKKEKIGL